ncbi:MAG: hypothetical protein AAGB26_12100 [Planctomycetota bacterium]
MHQAKQIRIVLFQSTAIAFLVLMSGCQMAVETGAWYEAGNRPNQIEFEFIGGDAMRLYSPPGGNPKVYHYEISNGYLYLYPFFNQASRSYAPSHSYHIEFIEDGSMVLRYVTNNSTSTKSFLKVDGLIDE